MSAYLLDSNIASDIIKGNKPAVLRRLTALPMDDLAISAVTEAELLHGVARRGRPPALTARVRGNFAPRGGPGLGIAPPPAPTAISGASCEAGGNFAVTPPT